MFSRANIRSRDLAHVPLKSAHDHGLSGTLTAFVLPRARRSIGPFALARKIVAQRRSQRSNPFQAIIRSVRETE
jgi:hypothetical protein